MNPAEVFHVGEYLEDELEARGWTTADCAARMVEPGENPDVWQLTLDLTIACIDAPEGHAGQRCFMGKETAERLERALGIDAQTWLNLEAAYLRAMNHESN